MYPAPPVTNTVFKMSCERQARVRLDFQDLCGKIALDALECRGVVALEAHYDDRRGVRWPGQSETVRVFNSHAVDRDDLLRAGELTFFLDRKSVV